MIDPLLIIPLALSFLIAAVLMPSWIRKAHTIGLVWDDMHKRSKEKVAGSGGVVVLLSFCASAFIFIAYRVFYLKTTDFLVEALTLILVVVFASVVGFVDDLIGWRRGGLTKTSRIILIALAAIPLMAINAGRHVSSLPLVGSTDLGFLYVLVIMPLGVIGATTTFNFLAGFNGLEAGQGILLLSSLATVAFLTGNPALAILTLCMVAALIGFILFNFTPARVFPGDVLTYATGATIAAVSIIGDFEKIALFFFIPYGIEVILKLRGKLAKQSFGKLLPDGSLTLQYDKLYGLEHVAIRVLQLLKITPTEKRVVYSIWFFQLLIIAIGFMIFKEGIAV